MPRSKPGPARGPYVPSPFLVKARERLKSAFHFHSNDYLVMAIESLIDHAEVQHKVLCELMPAPPIDVPGEVIDSTPPIDCAGLASPKPKRERKAPRK